jgi:hypothetical protein
VQSATFGLSSFQMPCGSDPWERLFNAYPPIMTHRIIVGDGNAAGDAGFLFG